MIFGLFAVVLCFPVKSYAITRYIINNGKVYYQRLKYRDEMKNTIVKIILQKAQKDGAIQIIKDDANNLPQNDQAKFIESVETELIGLHDGNFARYKISPSEFKRWKQIWDNGSN